MILLRDLSQKLLCLSLLIFGVAVVLIFGNYICAYLGWAAGGGLQVSAVFRILCLLLPNLLLLMLPISLFFSVLLIFTGLSHSHELWIILSAGISWKKLLAYCCVPAFLLAGLSSYLSFYAVPQSLNALDNLLVQATAKSLGNLKLGQFYSLNDHTVAYLPNSTQNENFILIKAAPQSKVIYAQDSQIQPNTTETLIHLSRGFIYDFSVHNGALNALKFENAQSWLATELSPHVPDISATPTQTLWQAGTAQGQVELRWRLTIGLLPFVAVFFALPFARTPPRSQRYQSLILPIGIFILWCIVLSLVRSKLLQNAWPSWLGFEWLTGSVVVINGYLLCRWDRRL